MDSWQKRMTKGLKKKVIVAGIIVVAIIIAICAIVLGNGKKTMKINEDNHMVMLCADNGCWGLVSDDEDYWCKTVYTVYYDGTLETEAYYHLSESKKSTRKLTEEEFGQVYKYARELKNDCMTDDACDGDYWWIMFYDEDGEVITNTNIGYAYSIDAVMNGLVPIFE